MGQISFCYNKLSATHSDFLYSINVLSSTHPDIFSSIINMSSVDTVTSTSDPRAANVVRYEQNLFEYSDYEFDSVCNEFHECSLLDKYACIYKSNIAAGLDDFAVIDDDAELNEEHSIITIPNDLTTDDFNPDVYGESESDNPTTTTNPTTMNPATMNPTTMNPTTPNPTLNLTSSQST